MSASLYPEIRTDFERTAPEL
ncbi:MAG: hypothetical protein RJA24_550, partial [Pseudomonadota bacterium]